MFFMTRKWISPERAIAEEFICCGISLEYPRLCKLTALVTFQIRVRTCVCTLDRSSHR